MSFSTFSLLVAVLLVAPVLAQDVCISTPTTCQCAMTTPHGTCLRSQGDGTCLLGLCSEGYRCDCFGYELCSIAKCGKHIPLGDARQSETVPFQCQIMPNAGQCTNVVGLVDTVTSANNAVSDASNNVDDATADEIESTHEIEEIQLQKKIINQMMKDLERLADDIPDVELNDIEGEADIVIRAVDDACEVLSSAIKNSAKASECLRDSRRLKRIARRRERLANEKKEILKNEEAKKERRDKTLCERLRKDIVSLTEQRKNASKECGRKASEARGLKKKSTDALQKARTIKKIARTAASNCMQKSQKSLGKVGARVLA